MTRTILMADAPLNNILPCNNISVGKLIEMLKVFSDDTRVEIGLFDYGKEARLTVLGGTHHVKTH